MQSRQMKKRPVGIFFLLAGASIVVAFQNCGQLMPDSSAVQAETSTQRQYQKDLAIVGRITNSSSLNLWISSRASSITKAGDDISSVASLNTVGFAMTPPLAPPTLTPSSTGYSMFNFPGGSTLVTNLPDGLISTSASILAVVELPLDGTLIRLSSGGYTEALTIEYGSGTVRARHYFDERNYESLSVSAGVTAGPMVIGASYGEKLGQLTLQVNGRAATGAIVNQGAPIASSGVTRQATVGDNLGSAKIGEVMAVVGTLTPAEINTMSRYLGDKWMISGVYYDASLYSPDDGGGGGSTALPEDVKQAIKSNCTTACHTHEAWSSYNNTDFKGTTTSYGARLVIPGDYLNSELYTRITGSEGTTKSGSGKSMPAGGAIVSPADLATIKNWIQNLK